MSIETKIFILNWIAVIATCIIDRVYLRDALQKARFIGQLFGLWCILSVLSVPVWIIWLIVTT